MNGQALMRHYQLPVARFPNVAYLKCCEDLYVDENGAFIGSDHNGVLSTGDERLRRSASVVWVHCPAHRPQSHKVSKE